MKRLFPLCGLLICLAVPAQLWADIEIEPQVRYVRPGFPDERAGSVTFIIDHDDFSETTSMVRHIRLTVDHGARLARTLVDIESSETGFHPIYLALSTPATPGVQINAGPEDVAIVRWRRGERSIWIRVYGSSSTWLLRNGVAGPPSFDQPVRFTLGHTALESANYHAALVPAGLANRGGNGVSADDVSDTSWHVDLSNSNLRNDPQPQLSQLNFDPLPLVDSEHVTTATVEAGIDGGYGDQVNFGPDSRIADGRRPVDVQHLAWIPRLTSYDARLMVTYPGLEEGVITLVCRNELGETHSVDVPVQPLSRTQLDLASLFPEMTRPFALEIHGLESRALLRLTHRKTGDARVIHSTRQSSRRLAFKVRAVEGDQTAVILLNTRDEAAAYTLRLVRADGSVLAVPTRGLLEPGKPRVIPVGGLVRGEGEFGLVAESDTPMIGVSYVYDRLGTPNMIPAEASERSVLELGGSL